MTASSASIVVSSVILAGGRSSRMGRDKAFLPFPPPDGPPLLARQAALLRSVGVADILVSGRPGVDYASVVPEARVVLDATPDAGPLAGIAAALAAARHPWLLVLAVDLPCLPARYLEKLVSLATLRGRGIVPQNSSSLEPLAALYPRSLLPLAEQALAARRLSLHGFLRAAQQAGLLETVDILSGEVAFFANWNTPADLGGPRGPCTGI